MKKPSNQLLRGIPTKVRNLPCYTNAWYAEHGSRAAVVRLESVVDRGISNALVKVA